MNDAAIAALIEQEALRQKEGLEMIPSENYVSPDVLRAMGSILTNKYSEGYPGRRYYGGNEFIDQIERIAQDRAKDLFGVPYANVQPYSGSPANSAVLFALLEPGDTIMGLALTSGGHLTHGHPKVTFSGKYFHSVQYTVRPDTGEIDYDEVERLAEQYKPKLIICGLTAYSYILDFERFSRIAESVGAYLMADIAHIAGLVVAGAHPSPVPWAHIVTTTTHKTLRGPRGAMILVTDRGLLKDEKLGEKIDKAIIPGMQGGPHNHTTAAIAVALNEAAQPEFKLYGRQIVRNADELADALITEGIPVVGGGTENHLLLLDLVSILGPGGGYLAEYALDCAGITVNKNTIPGEPCSPFYPSGIRCGTPTLTTRGMKEKDMVLVAMWMAKVFQLIRHLRLPTEKEQRKEFLLQGKQEIAQMAPLHAIKREVCAFASTFPVFA